MKEFRFAAPPEYIIAGYRPPARQPRTKKGRERFADHDPIENIQREYDNRTRKNKRSKFLYDFHPQDFDRRTHEFLTELEAVRDEAIRKSEPPIELKGTATLEDTEASQEYFRVKRETEDMVEDPSMRLYNLGPTLFPKKFHQMRDYIFRGLDQSVRSEMKINNTPFNEAIDQIKVEKAKQ